MSLGIPGDAVMALLLGALIIQGIVPRAAADHPARRHLLGPDRQLLDRQHPAGHPQRADDRRLGEAAEHPLRYLYPSAMFFVCIGVYAANNDMFQVGETLVHRRGRLHPAAARFPSGADPARLRARPRFEENFRRNIRHRGAGEEITVEDLDRAVGDRFRKNDRLLLRTDQNTVYDGSPEWMARAPYLGHDGADWCIEKGVSILGYDFYHGGMPKNSDKPYYARKLSANNIMTMPYLTNLGAVGDERFTLVSLPLKMIGVEASPIRAVALLAA
jgi:hypothetical protein